MEDAYHVLSYQDPEPIDVSNKSLQQSSNWMNDSKILLEIQETIIEYLWQWKQDGFPMLSKLLPSYLQELLQAQTTVGWHNFLEGFLHNGWTEAQARYYLQMKFQ